MKRKNLKAEDLAREICRQEKIGYETVHFLAEALLCRYAKGSGLALKGPNNMSKEMINYLTWGVNLKQHAGCNKEHGKIVGSYVESVNRPSPFLFEI